MTSLAQTAFPSLSTARLELIETLPSHADELFSIYGDAGITALYPRDPCRDRDECRALLGAMVSVSGRGEGWRWTLLWRDAGRVAGTVGFHAWNHRRREARISWELVPAARGLGLAAEAVRRILAFGRSRMGPLRVVAEIHPGNEPSLRLAERLGFTAAGSTGKPWRDAVVPFLLYELHLPAG